MVTPALGAPGAAETIESKSDFAKRMRVSAGRVSHWVGEGKITPDSLVGTGPYAQIRVERAQADLARNLHPGQLLARLASVGTPAPAAGSAPSAPAIVDRYQELRIEQKEIELRRAREDERARAGLYMRTADVKLRWGKDVARLVQSIDAWLPDLARTLAAANGLDVKVVTQQLKAEWRAFRVRSAEEAKAVAALEPELVDDDEPEPAELAA